MKLFLIFLVFPICCAEHLPDSEVDPCISDMTKLHANTAHPHKQADAVTGTADLQSSQQKNTVRPPMYQLQYRRPHSKFLPPQKSVTMQRERPTLKLPKVEKKSSLKQLRELQAQDKEEEKTSLHPSTDKQAQEEAKDKSPNVLKSPSLPGGGNKPFLKSTKDMHMPKAKGNVNEIGSRDGETVFARAKRFLLEKHGIH